MKKSLLLFLCLLSGAMYAQQQPLREVCGNGLDQELMMPRLRENKAAMEQARLSAGDRNDVRYVPVHFLLVADAEGKGRHKEFATLDQFCSLNQRYDTVGMQFYLSAHPTAGLFSKNINHLHVYDDQSSNFTMQLRRHPNAMNIFVVDSCVSGNNNGGITLAYYAPAYDWIVIMRSKTNNGPTNNTLAHEVGHFFSLPHTFFGYENNPFESSDPTWPNAPVIAPYLSGIATERQNGTNCATAADEICDTPPDYNFGFIQNGCAAYNGGARDPLGTLVDPMETNYMSYFEGCQKYHFTRDQIDIMNADLDKSYRNYLDNSFSPPATEFTYVAADWDLTPADSSTTTYYNSVLLSWESLPGATHYLLDIDVIPSFSTTNLQTYVVEGTSQLLTTLQSNKKYYWRIRPFNLYYTCAPSKTIQFRTSSLQVSTTNIEALEGWQVAPNPVSDNTANVHVNAHSNFEAAIRIIDGSGRTMAYYPNVSFQAGESVYRIATDGLSNGLYFVALESAEGRNVLKMNVLR